MSQEERRALLPRQPGPSRTRWLLWMWSWCRICAAVRNQSKFENKIYWKVTKNEPNRHSLPDRVLAQGNPFNVTPGGQVSCYWWCCFLWSVQGWYIVWYLCCCFIFSSFSKADVCWFPPTELAKASLGRSWRVDLTSRWNGEMMTMMTSSSHHDRVMMTMMTSSSHHDRLTMTMVKSSSHHDE